MGETLYDSDFYAWAMQQAALLRTGMLASADVENIAEEIESMGRSEKRELVGRLVVLLTHLLKWRYQPERRGKSWRLSIVEQRIMLENHMKDNPSLKSQMENTIREAYRLAVLTAERETTLSNDTFPALCPYSFEQMIDDDFWPENG